MSAATIPAKFRRKHHLIDRMDERPAVNELLCACGKRIYPDCDMSSVSIVESYEEHLIEAGITRERLDAWFAVSEGTEP